MELEKLWTQTPMKLGLQNQSSLYAMEDVGTRDEIMKLAKVGETQDYLIQIGLNLILNTRLCHHGEEIPVNPSGNPLVYNHNG